MNAQPLPRSSNRIDPIRSAYWPTNRQTRRVSADRVVRALNAATAHVAAPLAAIYEPALDSNASSLAAAADGLPLRLATKSVRSRPLLHKVLQEPGWRGLLCFSLAEALWLSDEFDDIVVAYPCVSAPSLSRLAADERARERITLMVDCVQHLDAITAHTRTFAGAPPIRVAIDIDASLRLLGGRIHLGVRRSPIHDAHAASALAREILKRASLTLVGIMAYEAQVAGLGDQPPGLQVQRLAIRAIQAASMKQVIDRRTEAVEQISSMADLEFVNGGGTGSIARTRRDPSVTEIAAGSGLYGPGLFDYYSDRHWQPAVYFALDVVRSPTDKIRTAFGGGWIASGPPGWNRLPTIASSANLAFLGSEGAGEVQTPVRVRNGTHPLTIGDRLWMRHAKAGELCEHVNELHMVASDGSRDVLTTYRGDGQAF